MTQHRRPRHAAVRRRGRRGRDHRLRAALHAARARCSHPMTLVRQHPPRWPAVRASSFACGRPSTTGARIRPDHRRQQPHPLRRRPDVTLRLTTDASLTAILEERPFFARATRSRCMLGPDETVTERRRRDRPPLHRGDDRVLARLGAPARDSVRVAERGDPRGDHAAAERVRRHRRDRRRDDDVDSRGAGHRRATGTIATAGCATAISSSTR